MALKRPRVILIASFLLGLFLVTTTAQAAAITATVKIGLCGDNLIGTGEQCDGSDLGGASCGSRGFGSGVLSCTPSCEFDTSACVAAPSSSGGGGGSGSGGGWVAPASHGAKVTFSGRAYPETKVTLLKDAQVVLTTVSGADANFTATIEDLSTGSYIFSVYGEDTRGARSPAQTFPVSVTPSSSTHISGTFIAPTISLDKTEVRQGDTVTIFGRSVPRAEVIITINSKNAISVKKMTDDDGAYLLNFDTSDLEMGQHNARSKAALDDDMSPFSKSIIFTVGTKNTAAKLAAQATLRGDRNDDRRVNLVDFSILAFWFKRPLSEAAASSVDLNADGRIDLVDFSILAYNWTG